MSALPKASPVAAAKVVGGALAPALARGLFSPRRGAMKGLTAVNADKRTVALLSGLKRKHGGEGIRLLGGRIVVVWGEAALHEVLDHSADTYASDAGAKAKGMTHFQPDALTLSRGDAWRDRRQFTEAVLASGQEHPDAGRFRAVVADEVDRLEVDGELTWPRWERLFDRITLRVIFGDRARDDTALTERLETLMGEANRIAGLSKHGDDYYELYGRLEQLLIDPEPGSLAARIAQAPHTDTTRVVQQLPHWMFAMRDTLAANAFRALALAVATGSGDREGTLQEAMRLWPTTPLLARETTRKTELAGETLDEGTQVIIVNTFNHRDPDGIEDADRFRPERWRNGARSDYRLNALSHGTQDCPGADLVSLIGVAALDRALERWDLELQAPDLDATGDLPHSLDFHAIRFAA